MKQVHIEQINVQNYRNFSTLSLDCTKGINIIRGPNGSGKTNILESISLLAPGKGLKSTHFDEICRTGSDNNWQSKFYLNSKLGTAEIAMSHVLKDRSRKISYNGAKIASSELSNLLNVVWLTPQMEDLFLSGANGRRKFLDRIVYNFNNSHAKAILKYEHFMRERNKILSQGYNNSKDSWLDTIEEKMALEAKSIAEARSLAVDLMQKAINSLDTPFPKAHLEISPLSEHEQEWPEFITEYKDLLRLNRQKDSYSGRTNFGVHRSDLLVSYEDKKRQARLCSTGEQKALLISLTLASIELIRHNTETTPIILLDELFVHLDEARKKHLANYIIDSKLQTFITTTDIVGLEELAKISQIIDLSITD
jgi:DNA replication and repair protein RecF